MLNSGQAVVAIITCIHSMPATPSSRMARRFSAAVVRRQHRLARDGRRSQSCSALSSEWQLTVAQRTRGGGWTELEVRLADAEGAQVFSIANHTPRS